MRSATVCVREACNTLLVSDFAVCGGSSTFAVCSASDESTLVGLAVKLNFTVRLGFTLHTSVVHTDGFAGISFTIRVKHAEARFQLTGTSSAIALLVGQTVRVCDTCVTLAIRDIADFLVGICGTVSVGTAT